METDRRRCKRIEDDAKDRRKWKRIKDDGQQ